jgi:hypothetical protein
MDKPENCGASLLDAMITDLIADMPLVARVRAANFDDNEFRLLEITLRKYVRHRVDQLNNRGNEELKRERIAISGKDSLDDVEAASVILKEL